MFIINTFLYVINIFQINIFLMFQYILFETNCYNSSYASTLIAILMTIVDCSSLNYKVVSRSTLFRISLCFSESYR